MLKEIFAKLKAQPPATAIEDPFEMRREYRHWRFRVMYSTVIGYAVFYFVRKNFSMAMPSFLSEFHYTKSDLGLILSLFSIVYGIAKLFNGILADKANPRYFMAIGLAGSAIVNIFFGLSSSLFAFGVFWIMNAFFQAMGAPPCVRMLKRWYSPLELGTKWGIWNSSHQLGGAGILVIGGYLINAYGWRSTFIIPAIVSLLVSLFIVNRLRDSPQSLGLPSIEVYRGERTTEDPEEIGVSSFKEILFKHVLKNKMIWYVSIANFFVYIVRIGVLDWAPTFLVEAKDNSLSKAGWMVAMFEIAGILGGIGAGWISDRFFKGSRGLVNILYMIGLIFCIFELWIMPGDSTVGTALVLFAIGFLVYGPQMLIGVASADFASKRATATANGMTGLFGYLGSTVCGVGTGYLVDWMGWDGGFLFFISAAVLGTIAFIPTIGKSARIKETKTIIKTTVSGQHITQAQP